ncbi:hypothetical protein EVG20_g7946 [Dentipellis fragilis]|uniref:Uncharacterized protein n=1 Tax=Dentipellis fragilis TaxID=205917 RepID=A0A4Y9Y9L1_9AGAM|nr:hypothetical protein EVG20_g7946 [Dentipellis fragilis]
MPTRSEAALSAKGRARFPAAIPMAFTANRAPSTACHSLAAFPMQHCSPRSVRCAGGGADPLPRLSPAEGPRHPSRPRTASRNNPSAAGTGKSDSNHEEDTRERAARRGVRVKRGGSGYAHLRMPPSHPRAPTQRSVLAFLASAVALAPARARGWEGGPARRSRLAASMASAASRVMRSPAVALDPTALARRRDRLMPGNSAFRSLMRQHLAVPASQTTAPARERAASWHIIKVLRTRFKAALSANGSARFPVATPAAATENVPAPPHTAPPHWRHSSWQVLVQLSSARLRLADMTPLARLALSAQDELGVWHERGGGEHPEEHREHVVLMLGLKITTELRTAGAALDSARTSTG